MLNSLKHVSVTIQSRKSRSLQLRYCRHTAYSPPAHTLNRALRHMRGIQQKGKVGGVDCDDTGPLLDLRSTAKILEQVLALDMKLGLSISVVLERRSCQPSTNLSFVITTR